MLAVVLFLCYCAFFAAVLYRLLGAENFVAKGDEIVFFMIFLSLIFTSSLYLIFSLHAKKIAKIIYEKDLKLKKQSAKIAKKNAEQQNLIEGICHEIKNPVAVIRLSAQSLPSSVFSEKIIYSSDKITKLLDTLNSAFIGDIKPKMETINLTELMKQIQHDLKDGSKRIKISGNKSVVCDKELMSLLLYNICENALKYSSDNILVKFRKSGIFVRDYGDGFDKSEKTLIFKKFYKANKHQNSGSLGFGLWACKQICKIHGFVLKANSTKHGSTFGVLC